MFEGEYRYAVKKHAGAVRVLHYRNHANSGNYADAIRHFEEVVSRDDAHARSEVWREIGTTYLESGSFEHARWALSR